MNEIVRKSYDKIHLVMVILYTISAVKYKQQCFCLFIYIVIVFQTLAENSYY